MENDTEFQNENGQELSGNSSMTVALLVRIGVSKVVLATGRVADIVGCARNLALVRAKTTLNIVGASLGYLSRTLAGSLQSQLIKVVFAIGRPSRVVLFVASGSLSCEELKEEHGEDGEESNKESPRVFGHTFGHAFIAEVVDGRVEQMQPGGRDNNTGTDVLANEEGKLGNVKSLLASQHYWKDGSKQGRGKDDEDGTNTESPAAELDGLAVTFGRSVVSHCDVNMCKRGKEETKED